MTRVPRPADHPGANAKAPSPPAAPTDTAGRSDPAAPADQGSIESLYPFLFAGGTDIASVLDQARASTVAKAHEVMKLREQVCALSGQRLAACARQAAERFAAGGRLLTFGNGGSATDAEQIATLFLYPGGDARPLPAIGLASDTAVLTSLANDIGVDVVFARQIAAFGRPGDIAIGLSTSGNSENLLRAFDEASRRGLMTIGIAGYDGGKMAELDGIDFLFVAPSSSIHRIQEAQTTIYHVLWELIVAELTEPDPA
ncbi:MAG TPA: SIS domain-containing protein [Streptosporangiaceae bacterium]|nr:SIS domain-containing protein [Streptosporangiaceae bacterium]